MQNTKIVTYFWSCGPLNIVDIENNYFYYVLVSTLYFQETSHKWKHHETACRTHEP